MANQWDGIIELSTENTIVPAAFNVRDGNVTGLVGPDGVLIDIEPDINTPTLIIGGDHPFLQWYGSNGSNGLLQMYLEAGVKPYIAINTDPDGYTYEADPTNYMSWPQLAQISGTADLVAHGHRHPQDWRLVNTGITVSYTGPAATATVAITATNIVGATAGSVEDFSFDITTAPYDTIAEVVAAIDALPNWTCSYASELKGSEKSTNLLLRSATTAKNVSLRLAAGGGILITNTGTTYKQLIINFNGTVLSIYGDGVRVLNLTIAGNTLSQVVTAINAVTGLTAELTNDNERNAVRYLDGGEDAACLANYKWTGRKVVGTDGVYLHAGLGHWYIVDRQLVKCKEVAASNGVVLKHFAQSGDKFYPAQMAGHSSYTMHRGNLKTGLGIAPLPFLRRGNHFPHIGISQTLYPTATAPAKYEAILNALIDSPGFHVCLLMHAINGDGSSGYTIPNPNPAGWNAQEADWYGFLGKIKTALSVGHIQNKSISALATTQSFPLENYNNLIFNPKLKNSGESLLVAAADSGYIVPGWRLGTLAAAVSAATIDSDGYLSVTTSSAVDALQQVVMLDPGVYEFSMQVPELTYSSGSGLYLEVQPYTPDYSSIRDWLPAKNSWLTTDALRGPGEITLRFSIAPPSAIPARVVSKNSQTYNLSTNKNIRLQIDGKTMTADIDCSAGASSAAATTAKEVAAAINAGMVANAATYGAEYHTIASAINGKVVLKSPYISDDVTGTIYVADGTSVSARTTIFGDECYGVASLADYTNFGGIPVTLGVEQNFVGTAKFGAFSLRKVSS